MAFKFLNDTGFTYLAAKIKTLLAGKADIAAQTTALEGTSPVTTAGTGSAYTVTVPGITALTAGISFIMIPHVASTTNMPTLNVNGLGAKGIRQPLTTNTTATAAAKSNTWLSANKPVRVLYDGTYWKTIDMPRPSASALYGSVPIESGGTGAETAAGALNNLGITYGDDLPSSAPNGHIFFKKV